MLSRFQTSAYAFCSLNLWVLLILTGTAQSAFALGQEFELKQDDRVVIIGSEFIEQQIKHNFLESKLIQCWPDRNIQVRNLGWAGDTPSAIARGYFNGAKEGYPRLIEEVKRINPTVVFVCYGANDGESSFESDLKKLLNDLNKITDRIVVFSHPPAEAKPRVGGKVYADVSKTNQLRETNAAKIKTVVESLKADGDSSIQFVDLYSLAIESWSTGQKFARTYDSIRYNSGSYLDLADLALKGLGVSQQVIDDPELRKLIAEKNELYFHRYRPQNETYLRGFRKHEQGQNAKEIAEFDALIAQAEARIFAKASGQPLPEPVVEPKPVKLAFKAATPAEEQATFNIAEGMEVSLFAAEPMVANPIHMNFDSKGRLWVATSPIYPQIKPGAKPRDEIVVLTDTDGDGVADKKTVFADDLLIPTAVLPDERGGCYVANSTEMLHLEDTDGDGKADRRRVVLSGFGTEDTHHIIHTFRWGPDAAIYFNQSIYIHTHMETPTGVQRLMGSGIWRFDPNQVVATVGMRGLVNPWGHIFNDWGQNFATDGAGGDGINYAFPGSAYPTAVGFSKVLQGMNPGQPKLCGLEIISSGHFPSDWQGTLVTNDFRGNRVNRFELAENESGYVSKKLPDLLSSSHRAFRPVDLKMGPDGSLFVADWYNPIINHGEVDFRDARRDYKHGRIWRVSVKGSPKVAPIDFESASLSDLIEMMKQDEQLTRLKSRVELKRRFEDGGFQYDDTFRTEIEELLGSANPRHQLEGVWTVDAIGKTTPDSLDRFLKSENHRVRAAAVRVASNQTESRKEFASKIAPLARDEHPQVRLEFINAWRSLFEPGQIGLLVEVGEKQTDQYIDFALANAFKDTRAHWLSRVEEFAFAKDPNKLLSVLESVNAPETVPPLLKLLNTQSDETQQRKLIGLIAERGSSAQLKSLFDFAVANETIKLDAIRALTNASRRKPRRVDVDPNELKKMLNVPAAVELMGLWKVASMKDSVLELFQAENTSLSLKTAAARSLWNLGQNATIQSYAKSGEPGVVRRTCITQVASRNPKLAATLAASFFDDAVKANKPEEAKLLVDDLLKRRNMGTFLAEAISLNPLPASIADSILSSAQRSGRAGQSLATLIKRASGKPVKKKMSAAEIQQLIDTVEEKGDPRLGEQVYRRDELGCIKCHAIGGAGGVVGPDMISLGASSPKDYIIDSMLNPSAKIKEGYHTTSVLTMDGILVTGKLMSDADGKVVLRDADNKEIVIAEEDIEEQKISTTSLMPAELTDRLSRSEFVDLIAFLSSLGKEGPFKVSSEPLVRRWIMDDQSVRYSRVDGILPVSDISGAHVVFEFDVTAEGTIGIHVENSNGLRITLDDMTDNLRAEKIVKDITKGRHRIKIRVNKANREGMRIKLFDVEGSKGRAELVNQ
jgi:putative heme-binding domain-containing protein